MKSAIALLALVALLRPFQAEAAAPKIAGASVADTDRSRVNVTFDGGPQEADIGAPGSWFVLLASKADLVQVPVSNVVVTGCSNDKTARTSGPCPANDTVVTVALVLAQSAPTDLTAIEVVYRGPLGPTSRTFKVPNAPGSIVAGAKKDDADVSFSGSYARNGSGGEKYNVDTFGGYMHPFGTSQFVGGYAVAKTKDAASIDPQSFAVLAAWRYVLGGGEFKGPVQGAIANALGGWEFSRKASQTNTVIGPRITVPFRISRGTLGLVKPGFTTPNGALHAGVEIVKPQESMLEDKSVRYRRLLGITLASGLQREQPGFYGITFKGLYEVRFLSAAEPYLDPRHGIVDPNTGKRGDAPLEFGAQSRRHAELSTDYLFAEWAGITLKYEYGSLPPAFALTEHTVTVSVTLALKQTSFARTAILKP